MRALYRAFWVQSRRCGGGIDKKAYAKIIRDLIKFFEGKKDDLLKVYKKEMINAAKEQQFELAAQLRNKIFFLEHIKDIAILKREDDAVDRIKPGEVSINLYGRIECYDISHISGTSTVASMVVFQQGAAAKAEYRKFHIKSHDDNNDVASMREVLMRRFRHDEWRKPDLVLIDGGLPQVHAAEEVMRMLEVQIPVVGIAKGRERKRNDIICSKVSLEICQECEKNVALLAQVRDEAHRFAITFHRKTRSRRFISF
jgi:excinuclease ABC subunit C